MSPVAGLSCTRGTPPVRKAQPSLSVEKVITVRDRKAPHAGLILLLALASLSFKCGGAAGRNDPMFAAARAADSIGKSIGELNNVKRELARQGKISPAEELKLTQQLLRLNTADKALVIRLKSMGTSTPDAAGQAQIMGLLGEVNAALSDLDSNAVTTLQNEQARSRLTAIQTTLKSSAQIIESFLVAADCKEVPPNCYQCGAGPVSCPPTPTPTPKPPG